MKTKVFERLKSKVYQSPDWESLDHDTMVERMVELTVMECVAICQDIDGEDSFDGRCARQDCAVEIREHFGVEE